MKFAFAFIALILLLTSCGRRDARLQQQVTGTWVVDLGNNVRSLNIIKPDGGYAAKITGFTNNGVLIIEGTFRVINGELVETVTQSSQANEKVPFVVHGRIISIDKQQMVTKWDTKPYSVVVVARRIGK